MKPRMKHSCGSYSNQASKMKSSGPQGYKSIYKIMKWSMEHYRQQVEWMWHKSDKRTRHSSKSNVKIERNPVAKRPTAILKAVFSKVLLHVTMWPEGRRCMAGHCDHLFIITAMFWAHAEDSSATVLAAPTVDEAKTSVHWSGTMVTVDASILGSWGHINKQAQYCFQMMCNMLRAVSCLRSLMGCFFAFLFSVFLQNIVGGDVSSGNSCHIPDKEIIPTPALKVNSDNKK